jgi:hypothetical protein
MISMISTLILSLSLPDSALPMMFVGADTVAQERLRLSATAEQGAVVTYSQPLDVRKHTLWGDRRAGLDLHGLRMGGTVRNSGDTPIRLTVLAVPDEAVEELKGRASRHPDGYYRERDGRTAPRALSNPNQKFLALFWIDIGPSTEADLSRHAPDDPAALQRMMEAGPVRFALLATSPGGTRAVRLDALSTPTPGRDDSITPPLEPFVQSRGGPVSLLDQRTFPATERGFFRGTAHYPGDGLFVFGGLNVLYPLERRFR